MSTTPPCDALSAESGYHEGPHPNSVEALSAAEGPPPDHVDPHGAPEEPVDMKGRDRDWQQAVRAPVGGRVAASPLAFRNSAPPSPASRSQAPEIAAEAAIRSAAPSANLDAPVDADDPDKEAEPPPRDKSESA